MPSRRFHQKSRHGCSNCKQRKIRCDEARPVCQNCLRLHSHCEFMNSDASSAIPKAPEVLTAPSKPPSAMSSTIPFPSSELLIANYAQSTCFTMTDNTNLFPLWQVTIPVLALTNPFLHHGLLALSALHLHSITPDPSYINLARQHQARALSTYIPALHSVNASNHAALFAFSAVITSLSYAFLLHTDETETETPFLTQLTNVFTYMLGTVDVAASSKSWIHDSALAPMLTPRSLDNVIPQLEPGPKAALEALLARIQDVDESNEQIDPLQPTKAFVYRDAIEKVSNAFPTISSTTTTATISEPEPEPYELTTPRPPNLASVFGWPVFVDRRYIALLKEQDPFALRILAHYGAGLCAFDGFWQLRGLGRKIVRAVREALGEDLHLEGLAGGKAGEMDRS